MNPTLFMVELTALDPAASAAWYRDRLGLRVALADPATGFTLLESPAGGRLAFIPGTPTPGGVTLHFQVADLDAELTRLAAAGVAVASPPKASPEGYRRATVRDPDGYAVGLFEWATPPA